MGELITNKMTKSISDEFESKLRGVDSGAKFQLIVFADGDKGYSSLDVYFLTEGVKVHARVPTLHSFRIDLNKSEIYSLSEKPYVKAIIETQRMHST